MMSSRIVTGAVLVGVLAVSPALAQERHARQRNAQGSGSDNGGDRGDRGESRWQPPGGSRPHLPAAAGSRRSLLQHADGSSRAASPRRRASTIRRPDNGGRGTTERGALHGAARLQLRRRPRLQQRRSYNTGRERTAAAAATTTGTRYNSARPAIRTMATRRPRAPYYRSYARPTTPSRITRSPTTTRLSRRVWLRRRLPAHAHRDGLPWRPYYYRPHFSIGVYYGAGGVYNYGYTPSYYYDPIPGQVYGGVRITEAPREAQVFADGYYVGIVDDFDGSFQHVNLEAGQHRIEVRAGGDPADLLRRLRPAGPHDYAARRRLQRRLLRRPERQRRRLLSRRPPRPRVDGRPAPLAGAGRFLYAATDEPLAQTPAAKVT